MRRLPVWLAKGGPKVSTLAYQIVCTAYGDPPTPPPPGVPLTLDTRTYARPARVVAYLCDHLDADEYDVLVALGELERVGVPMKPKGPG